MDAALAQLRAEGVEVHAADVARLSPLGFAHINMLGRYAFTLPFTMTRAETDSLLRCYPRSCCCASHRTNRRDGPLRRLCVSPVAGLGRQRPGARPVRQERLRGGFANRRPLAPGSAARGRPHHS
ncbi:Hypothetical protein MexAM1_p1METAp0013 (plasmid) [Methylorubrum extorquens AM1]|uniref:Tn3 transposase DDE domain-containing protein n=1 Tax=Methylorubrum extorquens (strain ATCC 14718 / DSM 1338 / JCM 2805 / NCIMB 9133 / AM1) TaxID=272630 RepID=C5B6N8_METEA|nr:Hypothetical protein MexAM1_p1METAp0013 [Methylorubrum extorquens AM1]